MHRLLDKEHVNVVVEWRGELMSMDQCGYKADIEVVVKPDIGLGQQNEKAK